MTPIARNARPHDSGVNLWQREVDVSRKDAFEKIELAARLLQKEDAKQSIQVTQDAFTELLREHMIVDEPYRLFGNLAMAYVMDGDRLLADVAIEQALALNSKYDFAILLRDRLEDGYYIGHFLEKLLLPGIEGFQKFSDEEILSRLCSLGITTSPEEFIREAERFTSASRYAEEMWKPRITSSDQENFEWLIAQQCYERWLPNYFLNEILRDTLQKLEEIDRDDDDAIRKELGRIERYVNDAPETFWTVWRIDIDDDSVIGGLYGCAALLETIHADRVCAIAERFAEKGAEYFRVLHAVSAIVKGDVSWHKTYENLIHQYPHDPVVVILVCDALCRKCMERDVCLMLEAYLERLALMKNEDCEISPFHFSRYRANTLAHEKLIEQYAHLGDTEAAKNVKQKMETLEREDIRATQTEMEAPDAEERFMKMIKEKKNIRSRELPSRKFFEYLQSLGICFETVTLTTTPVVYSKDGVTVKIGRNEPCPCGAAKTDGEPVKYKKCCGK